MTTQRHNINGLKLNHSDKCRVVVSSYRRFVVSSFRRIVVSSYRRFVGSKGFSLVELLVVVGIIVILSASSIAGFGYLGNILKTREVTGLLGDMIQQEELKILRGEFNKSTMYFLADYIVVDEEPADATLKLSFAQDNSCAEKYKIAFDLNESTLTANLIKKDEEGVVVETKSVAKNGSQCIEFKNSEGVEWDYQLIDSEKFSNTVRFAHFNIQRGNLNDPVSITDGAGSKIEITAPYGKKLVYDSDGILMDDPSDPGYHVKLKIEDKNGKSSDTLTLQ
jgi:prepilin-type N-terminal cleavage/methylation domain-containing protein